MNHKGTKLIETDRLILRKFNKDDIEAMCRNWVNDSEVTKYLTWKPHNNMEVTKDVLKSWIDEYSDDKFYQWAITLKENKDEAIGSISVVKQDEEIGMVHIGYCIGTSWWNKGITSEALEGLIKYFFTEVKANRVESRHDPLNSNSGKVMIKCGMKYEGTMRKADINNQGICDCAMYGILVEDYFSKIK